MDKLRDYYLEQESERERAETKNWFFLFSAYVRCVNVVAVLCIFIFIRSRHIFYVLLFYFIYLWRFAYISVLRLPLFFALESECFN